MSVVYGYDAQHRLITLNQSNTGLTSYLRDANGNIISNTDPLGRTSLFTFSARNQLTSTTGPDPDGAGPQTPAVTNFGYDLAGNQTSVTDPLGRTRSFTFSPLGQLTSQTDPDPDGAGPLEAPVTQYSFDLAGRLASLTDSVANVTSYSYDNAGRLLTVTDPHNHATQYQYDAAGQATALTDRNGRQRQFTFSALGLQTSETWLDGPLGEGLPTPPPIRTISWTYDDAGRMLSASDPDSSYAYTYDLAGQVLHSTNQGTPGLPLVELNFYYDFAGNRATMWDNLGGSVGYVYENHRLSQLSMSVTEGPTAQVDFAYDTVGRLTSLVRTTDTLPDPSLQTTYAYDDADRLIDITHESIVNQVPTTLSQFSYTFDAANQITSYTGQEGTLNYAYDQTGQLISVTGARTENYNFDVNGNRTMSGYTTGSGNRLTSDGTYNYVYDNEGNLLTKTRISDGQVTENTWDYRNRLTRIVVKDAQGIILKEARYTYDVDDRRIGVWEDADGAGAGEPVQRWTAYDEDNPWADFDGTGSLTTRYLYGPAIDQLFARIGTGQEPEWYLGDYLGSVRQIVKTDGNVLDEITYDSFGQILSESNPANGDRFKYTAREWDALFGQYYYRARYYGPDVGRFTSEDPLGLGPDNNPYRYVNNHPLSATDPLGLFWVEWDAFWGSIGDSVNSVGLGLQGTGQWAWHFVDGDNVTWRQTLDRAYDLGPLGQTLNGPGWAYYGTRVALGVATTCMIAVGGLNFFHAIRYAQTLRLMETARQALMSARRLEAAGDLAAAAAARARYREILELVADMFPGRWWPLW